jgi:hypothetical protein
MLRNGLNIKIMLISIPFIFFLFCFAKCDVIKSRTSSSFSEQPLSLRNLCPYNKFCHSDPLKVNYICCLLYSTFYRHVQTQSNRVCNSYVILLCLMLPRDHFVSRIFNHFSFRLCRLLSLSVLECKRDVLFQKQESFVCIPW